MKGMGNILKQAQKMQQRMLEIQEELENLVIEGSAAGGMVTARVNGKSQPLSLKINPEAVDPDDVEMLEDAVLAALQDAMNKAQEVSEQKMAALTGGMKGMGIPGF